MAIDAEVQTGDGEVISELPDPHHRVAPLLPAIDDELSVCLRFIDPYGNTIFNRMQVPVLIDELKRAAAKLEDDELKEHARELLSLAETALRSVHLYLKFFGD